MSTRRGVYVTSGSSIPTLSVCLFAALKNVDKFAIAELQAEILNDNVC